jgi:putative ABC transport system permease protein
MKFYDVADLAVRNLRESIFRNSLTTIGISVGVASLVAMLSLGIGLQQLASRRLQKSGLFDTVVATSRRDLRNFREQREEGPPPAESPSLTEAARNKIAQIPGVVEAYPDIRFVTDVRFDGKTHLTMVAGVPFSAKNNNDAFDGMQGSFFSSEGAPEAILQKSFAEELLGVTPKAGTDDTSLAELAKPLLGRELTMRYAERTPTHTSSSEEQSASAAYSVVSREHALKIVGLTDLDPDSLRGTARARVFLPLKLARDLHIMQSNLRDTSASDSPSYTSLSVRVENPNQVPAVEDAIKKMGFGAFSIVDANRSMGQFFAVLDGFLAIFGGLALAVASIGIVNTLVMAILERRRERRGRARAFLRRSGCHGSGRRRGRSHAWLGDRTSYQLRHEHLSRTPAFSCGADLVGTAVACSQRNRFFHCCQFAVGTLSRVPSCAARPSTGASLRVNSSHAPLFDMARAVFISAPVRPISRARPRRLQRAAKSHPR